MKKVKQPKVRNLLARVGRMRNGAGVHEKTGVAKVRHDRRKAKQKGYENE